MNKEKIVAPVMAGIITLTGCGSAAAASPNSESVGGGDKRVNFKR